MAILDFITAKFVMGYPCVKHYILCYIHGPAILLIRSLADIAQPICQIEKGSDGNFFLKRANELFFVSGHSNLKNSHQLMAGPLSRGLCPSISRNN